MPTRVLMVLNTFGCGGNERQMINMSYILKKYSDYSVSVLYYAHIENEFKLDGIDSVFIDKKLGRLRLVREMRKYIRENDIKIVHGFGYSCNIYSRMAVIGTNAIAVSSVTGQKYFNVKGSKLVNSLLNLVSNYWTVNNTNLVSCIKKNLAFVNGKRIRLLHNGFAPKEKIDYKPGENTEFDEYKKDKFVFCAMGRLHPVKNYPLFIKAAAEIVKTNKNVRFWMIGDGGEMGKLTALISEYGLDDYFKMWGHRTDTDVALSRADVFVQTSFTEGSPNTIAEAMRAEKPVISTDSCDLNEMIINGENGYIVENDNIEALAGAMRKLCALSAEERTKYGKKSYEMFSKTFTEEKVADEFVRYYDELLGKECKLYV